jgi:hypothetical protein
MLFGDLFMTGAKGAEALAKGQVYIQTDPLFFIAFIKTVNQGIFPIRNRYPFLIPKGHSGITGIPGAGYVVFLYQG